MKKHIDAVTASPLDWPEGWKRTPPQRREAGRFTPAPFHIQCKLVLEEIRLLGGAHTKLSTNLRLRRDELPYANQKNPEDPGVAVWFVLDGKTKVIACDAFRTIEANLRAIEKSVGALRGLDRWGCSTILDRAMKGMEEDLLPAPPEWWDVLGVPHDASPMEIRSARIALSKRYHPDTGSGDTEKMKRINAAFEEAKRLGRV